MPAAGATDEGRICELEDGIIVETVVKISSDIDGDANVIVLDKDGGSIVAKIFSDIECDADFVDRIVLDNIDCSKLEVSV